jgi:hypothetical protein
MSQTRIGPGAFAFERGIDTIVHGEDRPAPLPPGEVSPAFSPLRPRLEQLYPLPTYEDYLRAELAPLLTEAGLLLPYRFGQAISGARARLLAAAARDPRHARLLGRAVDVLDDQTENLALLQAYRMALMQG